MAREKYSCDFETTTKEEDCRVWAWAYININNLSDFKHGKDINSFMRWALKQDADLYFHNLRFDGSFIVHWLLINGYTVDRNRKNPKPKTFNTIISENGQWYSIDITTKYLSKGKGDRRRKHVTIYDSLKKIPFPVKDIAKTFDLPILKGEIDYNLDRPIGWELTPNEYSYLKNDVEIVARALKIQFDQGLTSITIGSDAMKEFKQITNKNNFERYFPVLSQDVDSYLRASYKGGFTWLNSKYSNVVIGNGIVFDVNSLYPWAMRYNFLPYGTPIKFDGRYEFDVSYPLHISRFECEFELKEGYIPTIQIKGSRFQENEYLHDSGGESVELTMTSVDIALMFEHYEVYNIKWLDGYKFRARNDFFNEYIDKWTKIKVKASQDGNAGLKTLAKLMLNNLYGKFGKNPDVTPKLPSLDESSKALKLSIPRDDDGFEIREFTDPVYIAMGSFITAYARNKTIRTAQKCYDRIIYCDTDSIHLTGTEIPEAIKDDIHPDNLGYWAHEVTFNKAKFLRQKTYVEVSDRIFKVNGKSTTKLPINFKGRKFTFSRQHTDIKCAGMPDRIKKHVSFDDFKIGFHSSTGKLMPKQVYGGCVLVDGSYTLK